tara:strand:+ start:1374 stop:2198 length:825 start_codon:yes stop_codon:yes gene_type:complete
MKIKQLLLATGSLYLAVASVSSHAHDIYIWPDYFTISSDKPTSVPVDITATHTTFHSDFSMPSEGVKIFGVDGKEIRFRGAFFKGIRRSTFDLPVDGDGTTRLEYWRGPSYRSSYTIGKRETTKRMVATKSELLAQLPEDAKNPETVAYQTIGMSFVTNNAPTGAVLKPANKGVELVPLTHPADYVTGEDLEVALLSEGKPIAGQDVTIELEGPQYQASPVVLELTSDDEGKVSFSFEQGGRYMMKVIHSQPSTDPEADIQRTRIYYAFEVIYE